MAVIERVAFGVPEAAAAMGVSASAVWKWISKGTLQPVRIGGRTLIPRRELERIFGTGEMQQ